MIDVDVILKKVIINWYPILYTMRGIVVGLKESREDPIMSARAFICMDPSKRSFVKVIRGNGLLGLGATLYDRIKDNRSVSVNVSFLCKNDDFLRFSLRGNISVYFAFHEN